LQTQIICSQTCNWIICHPTNSLLLHYLEKCNHIAYTSSQKPLNAMHVVIWISLLLRSRKCFIASNLWSPNSQDLNPVNLCSVESTRKKSIVWMNWNSGSSMSGAVLNSRFFDKAIDQWRGRLQACVRAKGGHFKYSYVGLLMNWQCWFCPYLLYSMWLVWLLHHASNVGQYILVHFTR